MKAKGSRSRSLEEKLGALRADYTSVTGKAFDTFFCPILFRDDDVPLCQAHIVNKSFKGAVRRWTVQRKDVDGFYGSVFESDFELLQYRDELHAAEVLADPQLAKKLNARLYLNGRPVEHFRTDSPVPDAFSSATLVTPSGNLPIGLKVSRDLAAQGSWEVDVGKDIRLPAIVSLLKAAHLTLFDLVGYNYALSAGGAFVGKDILGDFFLANVGKERKQAQENAAVHFQPFVHMVRPMVGNPHDLEGTLSDRRLFLCVTPIDEPFAMLTYIKAGNTLHAVLIPVFQTPGAVHHFLSFLDNADEELAGYSCHLTAQRWERAARRDTMKWPKTGILLP